MSDIVTKTTSSIFNSFKRRSKLSTIKQQTELEKAAKDQTFILIWVYCTNLRRMDYFSKTSSMATLFIKDLDTDMFFEVGRTNVVEHSFNPVFFRPIMIRTKHAHNASEEKRKKGLNEALTSLISDENKVKKNLRFLVNDVDTNNKNITDDDIIGVADFNLSELTSLNEGKVLTKPLTVFNRSYGFIHLRYEYVDRYNYTDTSKATVKLKLAATNLKKPFLKLTCDPYLVIKRSLNKNKSIIHPIYMTEVIEDTLDPYWKDIVISFNSFCNADIHAEITFEVYDRSVFGNDTLLGTVKTNLNDLMSDNGDYDLLQGRDGVSNGKTKLLKMNFLLDPPDILKQNRVSRKSFRIERVKKDLNKATDKISKFADRTKKMVFGSDEKDESIIDLNDAKEVNEVEVKDEKKEEKVGDEKKE